MGEKGLVDALKKLPKGARIDPDTPGAAFPPDPLGLNRPGPRIWWDEDKGAWTPVGFQVDPTDSTRVFNPDTGQNGVWDGDRGAWIDAQTGKPID